MSHAHRSGAWIVALACSIAGLLGGAPALAQAAAPATQPEAEFVYRFQARDTLIGISRRLLLQPGRWPELQTRNRIANPRTIPADTPIRIPWSWLRLKPDTAQVQAVNGTVTRGGIPVTAGEILAEGTVIETGEDGTATLTFADGSITTLQKSSVLKLQRLQQIEGLEEHGTTLQLDAGRIETTVKPKRDVGRFEIVTPVAVSAVRGTRFRNSFDQAARDARAETLEGTVNVAAALEAAAVTAGFGTRVDAAGTVLPPVALLAAPDLAVPQTSTQPSLRVLLQPVAGAARYRVQLAGDADFRAISFDAESVQPEFSIAAVTDGDHWLRARAIDSNGIEGVDTIRQVSQHLLPAAPVLATPVADARIVGTSTSYTWSGIAGIDRYRVQLARDEQFADLVADREVTGATQLVIESLPAGRYFWRTASLNSQGEMGEWSPPRSHAQRPPAPTIGPMEVMRREIRLHWQARPGEKYRLQIARDARFEQLITDARTDAGEIAVRRPAPGTYYARIQVLDPQGVEDPFGETRRFEVELPLWLKVLLPASILLPLLP